MSAGVQAMGADARQRSRSIIARIDRFDAWSLPYFAIVIIGIGFLFTFYDIFDINVSWIQTCAQIKKGCTAANANASITNPILVNLLGYVVGALVFSPLADRFGRRNMLIFTMALTGLGSLWTALVHDYNTFIAARGVTGIGVGADLAIVNTYVGELAPRSGRAKWLSFIFIMSALGATIGIWLGLILTTPSAPFPKGFPATINTMDGWKIMYYIGAGLALLGVLLRVELPESPRWLVSKGRLDEADRVTERMEEKASKRGPLAEPVPASEVRLPERKATYAEIVTNPTYRWRALLLIVVWSAGYVTVYSYAAGFVSVLTGLGLPPPEAGILVAVGVSGFLACAVLAFLLAERLERKLWLPLAAVITMAGALVTGLAGKHSVTWAFFGVSVIFLGFNVWVPITYAWSIESFPTRARTSGYAIGDGLGHGAGAAGVKWVVPLVVGLSTLSALVIITSFLCFAALVAQLGIKTRNRVLDEISP